MNRKEKAKQSKVPVSDPLLTEFRRLSPKVTGGILRAREAAFESGMVLSKTKLLAALAVSIVLRCEPCIRAYVQQAVDQGATQEELIEFLNVAMALQGCPGETWAIKAYRLYKEIILGRPQKEAESCCETHDRPSHMEDVT